MRVCMISPHLPPDQGANALLPVLLGDELASHGVTTRYVAHPSSKNGQPPLSGQVAYVPRRGHDALSRSALGAAYAAGRMALGAKRAVLDSDLIHLHSNGLIIETGQRLARQYGKPYVITLYGTDVWHHDARRNARFARVVRGAASRAFYSRGLLDFAHGLDLAPEPSVVIYPPVASTFQPIDEAQRETLRYDVGLGDELLLLTVKRLHPVAGHDRLLQALPHVLRRFPRVRLWLAGEGELRPSLEAQARDLNLAAQVRFLGRLNQGLLWRYYVAADLFVLPSRLESWGTVILEALACGTPAVVTETVGGREVHEHFPEDVEMAGDGPEALADAINDALGRRRRATAATHERLRTEFSASHCAARYLAIYHQALGSKDRRV